MALKSTRSIYDKHHNLLKYLAIGVFNTLLNQGLFILLFNVLHWNKYISDVSATHLAIISSFSLNTYFNFKTFDRLWQRFASFYAVNLVGIGLSLVLLWLGSDVLHINTNVVKIATIPVTFGVMYVLNRLFTFRSAKSEDIVEPDTFQAL